MASRSPQLDADALRAALQESEARYASLLRRAGYGAYRSGPSGELLDANQAMASMLGYDAPSDLIGLDLGRDVFLDPDERARLAERAVAHGFPDWVDTRWKRRDGSPVNVRVSLQPRRAGSDADGWEGVVQDVTERQRQEELRRRSERLASIGATLAGVAHELNNPLAAIMGFAQLLLKKPWPAEDRAALEAIHHESIRSATIVKDLLALARKRDVERRVRTDVNDVVGYIVRTRRYALETAGVHCDLDLAPALPSVHGDRAQLEQVIINLINNAQHALTASDAAHRPGHLRIRTRHDERHVIVEVEDDGPGIPADVRARIWDPFWTTKGEGEGTGLGLSVAHGIVADHGGSISLEESAGTGARFVIRLPIAVDAAGFAIPSQASKPLDVLVVDPGASDLLFVERFLTSRGHAVINAGSGELALRLAAQSAFDAVLCDARLLGRDGKPVAASLREAPTLATARFVLSVASPLDDQHLPTTVEGAVLVARPYDVEELRRLIEGD